MISIERFEVMPMTDKEALYIVWEPPAGTDTTGYKFSLSRMGSPDVEFNKGDILLDAAENTFSYIDDSITLSSKYIDVWYRLKIEKGVDSKILNAVRISHDYDDIALEIIDRLDWLLEGEIGVPLEIYKEKEWGKRCPTCWDDIKKATNRSDCPDCYDIGWYGGYWDKTETYGGFNPPEEVLEKTKIGDIETSKTMILFSNYPKLSARDIIKDPAVNEHWKVSSISKHTRKKRALVHQVAQCDRLAPENVGTQL